jgi:carbon-monoxide dehydrogenase medium subunit
MATGDPLSCLLIALLVLDAEVHLSSHRPSAIGLDRLLEAPRKFLDGKLITSVTALSPVAAPGVAMAHVARTPRDKPIVAVAVRVTHTSQPHGDVRIALAGVADRPVRAYDAEQRLKGGPFEQHLVDEALAVALKNVNVPSDFRGSREYRRAMAAVLTGRALLEARGKLA